MVTYSITCGTTKCEIWLESRPRLGADPVFVATPYLVEGPVVVPIEGTSDARAELQGDRPDTAVEDASVFLEHRLGQRVAPARLTMLHADDDARRVAAPRPMPMPTVSYTPAAGW